MKARGFVNAMSANVAERATQSRHGRPALPAESPANKPLPDMGQHAPASAEENQLF